MAYGFNDRKVAERLRDWASVPQNIDGPVPQRRARPTSVGVALYVYELTSTWAAGDTWPEAECKIYSLAGNDLLEEEQTVCDVLTCHDDMGIGDKGVCIADGDKYYTFDTPCTEG